MFSGKTTWLNSELTQLADKGLKVLKIVHALDNREDVASNDTSGSTHNSSYKSLTKKISCARSDNLRSIQVENFEVVGVDESQFFPDLFEVVTEWVEVQGKHVRVSGLDGDSSKRKFGQTLDLIPLCDEVVKLRASCKYCLEELRQSGFKGNLFAIEGPFTKRTVRSEEQTVVGGSDLYVPVCRYHSY